MSAEDSQKPGAPQDAATPAAAPAPAAPSVPSVPRANEAPSVDAAPTPDADLVLVEDGRVATEELLVQWAPKPKVVEPEEPVRRQLRFAGPALITAIFGLVGALFTGWLFPLALIAIVIAIVALRRSGENRAYAAWALALGLLALVYSVGWFLWMWSAGGFGTLTPTGG